MSTCPSDQRPLYHLVRTLPRVLVILSAVLVVGCGGGNSSDAPTPEPAIGGTADSTMTENADEPAAPSASSTPSAAPTADAVGGGMQLPDQAIPGADSTAPGGPTGPGAGGIEMPDLDALPPSEDSASSSGENESGVQLQFASWQEIESHAKSTGKVTVVDLWSTVCEPCVKEFPGLVRLSKSMPRDVSCIGVAVDYDGRKSRPPEYYQEKVTAFLNAMGAGFDNYLCNTPSDDVFATVDIPSIPAVLIFDADGKLVKQFVDAGDTVGFSYESDIIPFVEKLAG
ncbi:thiol-disulfide oxidoreductase [Stieleria maiorica]|uniref:Thiol-disulfide oxidoreductase n=1 Tax=Stieleria maiorica TaxID=2795974 RepID=A0A5B9M6A6_9BACT|nr:TlpA disulfide reductase family protein [Stieleria maiorica]QEF96602.1 thiol-disulfide oxidoreductase [Stieleria maiorica]